jgi:phasin family protein
MLTIEQVMASQKAQLEAVFGLGATAFEGAEKLMSLNVATSKALMSEAAESSAALLQAKDPAAAFGFLSAQAQPSVDKFVAYNRQAFDIVSETGAEIGRAVEAQVTQQQASFGAFVDAALKNAPAGSESASAFIKSAMAASQNAQAMMQKAVKQATDMAQQSVQAAAAQTMAAAPKAAKKR